MDLTDEQWTLGEPLIPKPKVRADGRGRPWCDDREGLHGILWILRTGAHWPDVPDWYPSRATCHRRHQEWSRTGVFNRIRTALAADLRSRGKLELCECFVDATFVVAKKGGFVWAPLNGAKVRRSWQWQTALVFQSRSTWPVLRPMGPWESDTPRPSLVAEDLQV